MQTILTDRESKILEYRFLERKTLEETGRVFGVTRERIRQIEAKAMEKVREFDKTFDKILLFPKEERQAKLKEIFDRIKAEQTK